METGNDLESLKTAEKLIERSCINAGFRTMLYFCHPFCSSERGTTENTNKLIRKYIFKGADIGKYTDFRFSL